MRKIPTGWARVMGIYLLSGCLNYWTMLHPQAGCTLCVLQQGYWNRSVHVALGTRPQVMTPFTVSSRVAQVESKSTRRGFNDIVFWEQKIQNKHVTICWRLHFIFSMISCWIFENILDLMFCLQLHSDSLVLRCLFDIKLWIFLIM